jgi:hypothetical protein
MMDLKNRTIVGMKAGLESRRYIYIRSIYSSRVQMQRPKYLEDTAGHINLVMTCPITISISRATVTISIYTKSIFVSYIGRSRE